MTDREAMELALETLEGIHVGNMTPMAEENWNKAIAILRQALEQPEQVNVPEGWKLVPIEPTDAMLSVPVNIDLRECVTPGGVTGLDAVGLFRAWEAMIEAAPQPWDTTDMAHRAGGLSMEQEPVAWIDAWSLDELRKGVEGVYIVYETEMVGSVPLYAAPTKQQDPYVVAVIGNWGRVEWAEGVYPQIGDKMYSAPPKREWVELTFEEADRLASKYSSGFRSDHNDALHLVGEVEALLKEKNT